MSTTSQKEIADGHWVRASSLCEMLCSCLGDWWSIDVELLSDLRDRGMVEARGKSDLKQWRGMYRLVVPVHDVLRAILGSKTYVRMVHGDWVPKPFFESAVRAASPDPLSFGRRKRVLPRLAVLGLVELRGTDERARLRGSATIEQCATVIALRDC
jgi:hypothetical protein